MKEIGKSKSDVPVTSEFQTAFYHGKLKEMDPNRWVEFIAGVILELMQLNLQQIPQPGIIEKLADKLYNLLKSRWPGVTQDLFYRTIHNGYTKQGAYGNFRVTYPLLANWVLYQQVRTQPFEKKEIEPWPLHEQARELLAGLVEYRKAVEAGEYEPKGRRSENGNDSS